MCDQEIQVINPLCFEAPTVQYITVSLGLSLMVAWLILYNDVLDALSQSPFKAGQFLGGHLGNAVFYRFGNWENRRPVCEDSISIIYLKSAIVKIIVNNNNLS